MSSSQISISRQLFDADIQIPEMWLQAPLPFPTPLPECSGELAHRLEYHRRSLPPMLITKEVHS